MIDSAMFYIIGTLYPYVARATYPALGFPQYPGEVGASDADAMAKDLAQKAALAAIAEPLDVFHKFYMDGKNVYWRHRTVDCGYSTCSDARVSLCHRLSLPHWAKEYIAAMESALGSAYVEPAADVRGYITHVRSQKK